MQNKLAMQNFVLGLLNNKLSKFYYYHNAPHTMYVVNKAIEIAEHEKCTAEEIDLISVAALWHDAGYINTYAGHEEESCMLAKKYLPEYGYSFKAIETICGMIMATKIPQSPKNLLEQIIADADLEYLGTPAAGKTATELYKELKYINPLLTKAQWHKIQIKFLQQHHYFTNYCKTKREPSKQAYLKKIKAVKK